MARWNRERSGANVWEEHEDSNSAAHKQNGMTPPHQVHPPGHVGRPASVRSDNPKRN